MEYQYEEIKKTKRTITSEPFYKNLVKVFDKYEIDINGKKSEYINVLITSKENLDKVEGLKDVSTNIYTPGLYKDVAQVYMISKSNFDLLLRGKAHVADSGIIEEYNDKKYCSDNYTLVLFNWGSHELADLDGQHIPIAVRVSYDYSCGRMTNKHYNLNDVIEKLKGKSNVIVYNNEKYSKGYGKECELKITKIPYYNASDDEYEQLEFFFIPSKEIYNEAKRMSDSLYDDVPFMLEKIFGIKKKTENNE